MVDLALALTKVKVNGREKIAPYETDTCTYHEHEAEGKPCYKTMFQNRLN